MQFHRWWVSGFAVAAIGCAQGGDGRLPPPGYFAGADGSTGHPDGGRIARDSGAPRDAGSSSDRGLMSSDAGASSAPDAGGLAPDAGPGVDAGPPPPLADCAASIDVSGGGIFVVDTCAMPDDVGGDCAASGAGDALLVADAPFTGSTYHLGVPSGWVIQQMDESCRPMPFGCAAEGWGVSGAIPWAHWHFAVQRADGSCGTVAITVERPM